jgi:hypothetical protein
LCKEMTNENKIGIKEKDFMEAVDELDWPNWKK